MSRPRLVAVDAERRIDASYEERRVRAAGRLGSGTLACPDCDAPVALAGGSASPADPLGCPFCGRDGAVRDFLSLVAPSRPARVAVRVVLRAIP
jgi:hypothetical protein